VSLDEDARAELAALEAAHRLRVPRVIDGRQGPTLTIDGVEVVCLASNDYLSLAGDRRLAAAAMAGLERDGVGAGASRLITGTQRAHVELEAQVADWLQCGGVRLFNTGYAANVGVITTIAGAGDRVFSDELNHASIIDGCRLSRASVEVFRHRDLAALERALAVGGGRRRIVVTESLFSMDGDVADLGAIAALCMRFDAALVVDEAHAIGAHGAEGRGLCSTVGVAPDILIGTFGKALGTFGAFAATTRPIADLLWNRARPFVFSTALPPSIPSATRVAIEIVRGSEGDDRRRTLARHARRFRELVPRAGGSPDSAIAPILVGDDREVMRLSRELLAAGVFVQGIRPPTVPLNTARLRASLNAGHSPAQIETAARKMGIGFPLLSGDRTLDGPDNATRHE
jgi:8-amino-7-oxononanoate synthase